MRMSVLVKLSSIEIKHIITDTTPSARITGMQPNGDERFIFKRDSMAEACCEPCHGKKG
jgi:hypothetical protein